MDETLESTVMASTSKASVETCENVAFDLLKLKDKVRKALFSPKDTLSESNSVTEKKNDECSPENESASPPLVSDNDTEESYELCYNPFSSESDLEITPVVSDTVLSRIGPFTDNRPICDCDIVKKMMSGPDTRYLLSLLPDMSEMNAKQKEVFKSRVISALDRVLEEIS